MEKRHPVAAALAVQALCMAALGACCALSGLFLTGRGLSVLHGAGIWLAQPVCGLLLSMRCAKKGVPAILAWLLAPSCFAAAYWLIVGMAPHLGAAALCALAGVIGASAGEVWLKRSKN